MKRALAWGALGLSTAAATAWRSYRRVPPTPPGTVHPPLAVAGVDGVPVLGLATRMAAIMTDPLALGRRNAERYGPVFTLRIPITKLRLPLAQLDLTYLLAPDAYDLVLRLPVEHASMGHVLQEVPTVGFWFPRSGAGDPASLQQLVLTGRSLLAQLMSSLPLQQLTDSLPQIVEQHIRTWPDTIDLGRHLHPIVYEASLRHVLGARVWQEYGPRLIPQLRAIADGIDIPRASLSATPWHYRMSEYRGTRALIGLLTELVARTDLDAGSPLLSALRQVRLDGHLLPLVDQTWLAMYACWNMVTYPGTYAIGTLLDLLDHPPLLAELDELEQAGGHEERLRLLRHCLLETIRLHPVSSLVRSLRKPLEYEHQGVRYHIPAGGYVGVLPGALARDPARVGRPDDYDPHRHANGSAQMRQLLFGAGPYACVAARYAQALVAGVLDQVLSGVELTLAGPTPERTCRIHLLYPAEPIPARAQRRTRHPQCQGGAPVPGISPDTDIDAVELVCPRPA